MGDIVWAALVGILQLSLSILWLPFGLLIKHREYVIAVVPYLVVGALAVMAAALAFGFLASVFGALFTSTRWMYRACRSILKAFIPSRIDGPTNSSAEDSQGSINSSDPYQILGVAPGVTSAELTARYRHLMSVNHPDKVVQLDPEIQAFASERSRRIIEAYEELRVNHVATST